MINPNVKLAFGIAKDQYQKSPWLKFYHVTLAYSNNKLVVTGNNKPKTHPALIEMGYHKYSFIHSELDVLLQLTYKNWDVDSLDLFNFCFSSSSVKRGIAKPRQSAPCKHCAAFVIEFKSITYFDKEWKTERFW
jgi:hypothetical protein